MIRIALHLLSQYTPYNCSKTASWIYSGRNAHIFVRCRLANHHVYSSQSVDWQRFSQL